MYERCVYQTMDMIQDACHHITKIELRDLFAMSALASFGGGSWNGSWLNIANKNEGGQIERAADVAYRIADAMLERRKK